MRRIFTSVFLLAALMVASFNLLAQCTATTYNFSSGTTEGFTGAKTSGTGTFTALAGSGGQLRSTVTANSANTYAITSPTFTIPNIATTINLSFTYGSGSQATISGVQYAIRYVNTSDVIVQTAPVAYTSGTCVTVPKPANFSGNAYQIVAIYTVTDGNGNSSNGFISFDNFGTNGTLSLTELPVKFQALDATSSSSAVALRWAVGIEDNLKGYDIEKSDDGRKYVKIGFVSASGQSSYSFIDSKLSPLSYYRIKSIDIDGKYAYSTVALVKAGKSLIVLKAFPSPVVNSLVVQHPTATAGSTITINSEDGRLIKSIIPLKGTQQTEINISTARPGLYLLRYANANSDVETIKILKQ